MSERFAGYIIIGGRLRRSQLNDLLKAVREAGAALDWGEPPFAPATAEQLLTALRDRHLWLCDEQASWGEFPELEKTCRTLGLGYTRHSDSGIEWDAELVEWRSGMAKPLAWIASNWSMRTFLPTDQARKVLKQLTAGRVAEATRLLRGLCPNVSRLPAFRIV